MKSKMMMAVVVLGLVAVPLLAQETITLDFESEALGSTNAPPGWNIFNQNNQGTYVVADTGNPGKSGNVDWGGSNQGYPGIYFANETGFDATKPISGSFDFYIDSGVNYAQVLFVFGDVGDGLEQTAGNYLNAVLQKHTFGQRARLFDADGEIIHNTDGNNTFSIDSRTWIPATFTWTPTNGLTGTFELSWMVGASARGPLVADDYTLNSDEAFVGFGTGREPGRFDNISVTGFSILEQGTVVIIK